MTDLSPAARRYVDLLDRYLSLPDGDESMDAAVNAAHDALTPDEVAAVEAWHLPAGAP